MGHGTEEVALKEMYFGVESLDPNDGRMKAFLLFSRWSAQLFLVCLTSKVNLHTWTCGESLAPDYCNFSVLQFMLFFFSHSLLFSFFIYFFISQPATGMLINRKRKQRSYNEAEKERLA